VRTREWLTITSTGIGCANRSRPRGGTTVKLTGWSTGERIEKSMPHSTNNMMFLDIQGGPLNGHRMPFVTNRRRSRPSPQMIQDIVVNGVRAVYVFNPVDDRWVCRYEEEVEIDE